MKKTTKLVSLIMAVVIAFSCMSVIAFAEDHVHSYQATVVSPKCAEQGYTLYVCTTCGDSYKDNYVPANGHIWGTWKVLDEATCVQEGHEERICGVCEAKETKTISVTDHVDADGDNLCDVCGTELEEDEYIFNPYDWIMAFINFIRNWFAEIFK